MEAYFGYVISKQTVTLDTNYFIGLVKIFNYGGNEFFLINISYTRKKILDPFGN